MQGKILKIELVLLPAVRSDVENHELNETLIPGLLTVMPPGNIIYDDWYKVEIIAAGTLL